MRRFYLRERLQALTSRKRQLERLSTDFYDWCNDSVCTSAWSRIYEHLEMLMSQGMQMGLLSSSVERRKRFFAPRLMEKVLTNRKHGLDHAIRFWITHDYVINCSWKSLRFCSFGRNIAFTKLVVSHKRRQMQRVFIWTFFIVVRHTISPPNESHMSCYILHMDFLKHSTHIIGAIFTKSTIPEIFYAKQWDTCNIYSKYSLYLFSYYCICMYFWKF